MDRFLSAPPKPAIAWPFHISNSRIAVIRRQLIVHGGGRTLATISGVAFYNRTVYTLDEIPNELDAQIVAARFARGDFDGYMLALRLSP